MMPSEISQSQKDNLTHVSYLELSDSESQKVEEYLAGDGKRERC